jgi:hypothetical protein
MGCFNTTGFISQLPIRYRDKVVCFIATSTMGINMSAPIGMYYPGSLVTPYFLPIYGEYNDYGSLEDIEENQITQMICKYAEETDLETLLENISRGEHVKLPNKYNIMADSYSIGEFTLLFEHRDVYDEITKSETYLSDKFNNMFRVVDWYVDFTKKLKEYTDYVPALPFNIAMDYYNRGFWEFLKIESVPDELKEEYEEYSTQSITDRLGWSFNNDNTFFLFKMLSKEDNLQAMILGKEEIRKFLNLYATYVCIPNYFKFSKTAGEQSYSLEDFRKIHDIIGNKLTELEKREVEEEEE